MCAVGGLCVAFGALLAPAHAAPAGSVIGSTASATYGAAGVARSVLSDTAPVRVDELLDVAASGLDAGPVTVRPGPAVLRFVICNTGNGPEHFVLDAVTAVAGNGFDAGADGIAIDSNGNEAYDAGINAILPAPATTPSLAADGTQAVFVLLTFRAGSPMAQPPKST